MEKQRIKQEASISVTGATAPLPKTLMDYKVRLQWSGYLQFIPNVLVAAGAFGISTISSFLINNVPKLSFWEKILSIIPINTTSVLSRYLSHELRQTIYNTFYLLLVRIPHIISISATCILIFDLCSVKLRMFDFIDEIYSSPTVNPDHDMDIFEIIKKRRSCRSFRPKDLGSDELNKILQLVKQTTHKDNLLGNDSIRFEYIKAPLRVWPVLGAHEFLVAIAPSEYNRTAIVDVGRSLEKIVLNATKLGISTCWIGPGSDQTSIEKVLSNQGKFDANKNHVICVCAIGYSSMFLPISIRLLFGSELQRRRRPINQLFYVQDKRDKEVDEVDEMDMHLFNESLNVDEEPFDKMKKCSQACRLSPSSFNSQTTRAVAVLKNDIKDNSNQLERIDFYATTKSRYYAPIALGIWLAHWELSCKQIGIDGRFVRLNDKNALMPGKDEDNNVIAHRDMSWMF